MRAFVFAAFLIIGFGGTFLETAAGCPFCTALKPTLSQQREAATAVALAEVVGIGGKRAMFRIHRVLKGSSRPPGEVPFDADVGLPLKPGGLVILFGAGDAKRFEDLAWSAVAVNETSYGYFSRAPLLRTPSDERLRYFARFLEHPDALISEDAYLEFGHAPYGEVARAHADLPMENMRAWLVDDAVRPEHKGFYGLALGLAVNEADRKANETLLRKLIDTPEDDFRAGFDGVLGGYLMLTGARGLEHVEARYFTDPKAAPGDVRHAMTALRFYHEYGQGRGVSEDRMSAALRHVLARPEFAEAAITDLARWKDWGSLATIAGLYQNEAYAQAGTRRAIVGYLLACPLPAAKQQLVQLRSVDPTGVSEAEQVLSTLGRVQKAEQ